MIQKASWETYCFCIIYLKLKAEGLQYLDVAERWFLRRELVKALKWLKNTCSKTWWQQAPVCILNPHRPLQPKTCTTSDPKAQEKSTPTYSKPYKATDVVGFCSVEWWNKTRTSGNPQRKLHDLCVEAEASISPDLPAGQWSQICTSPFSSSMKQIIRTSRTL